VTQYLNKMDLMALITYSFTLFGVGIIIGFGFSKYGDTTLVFGLTILLLGFFFTIINIKIQEVKDIE
jgi:hypothetical protein